MKKYFLPIMATLLLCVMFFKLTSNYSNRFDEINRDYENGLSLNLNKNTSYLDIKNILTKYDYISNPEDAAFVAQQIKGKFERGAELSELYDINKRIWQLPSRLIDSIGSPFYKEKLIASQLLLGMDDEYKIVVANIDSIKSRVSFSDDNKGEIKVVVKYENDNANALVKHLKLNKKNKEGVVVRLSRHYLDSLNRSQSQVLSYSITDENGECYFSGLDTSMRYSVLPICEGYEYGSAKGTVGGTLGQCTGSGKYIEREFLEKEHRVRMFDNYTLKNIKEDNSITLRTPKEYINTITICLFLFLVAWWILCYVNARRNKEDVLVISILMMLTGLCLLSMFSINNPLTDKMLGVQMTSGIIIGVMLMCMLQSINFVKFYQNQLKYDFDMPMVLLRAAVKPFVWLVKPFKDKMKPLAAILGKNEAPFMYKLFSLLLVVLCTPLLIVDLIRIIIVKIGNVVGFKNLKTQGGSSWIAKPFKEKIAYHLSVLNGSHGVVEKCIALLMILFHTPLLLIDMFYLAIYSIKSYLNIKGSGYLILALVLTILLFTPLGTDVGGMTVNLNIGFPFQPSEIAKYLIVFFMASFFCLNADAIMKYSEKGNLGLTGHKIKILSSMIFGIGFLLALYFVLGDMGPALVLSFTFIILYSVIKSKVDLKGLTDDNKLKKILTCDLAMLFYGVVSFIVMMKIGSYLGHMGIFCVAWFMLWIVGMLIVRKQIFESAILFNLIIAAFVFGGTILNKIPGFDGVSERLESRKEMCTNTWGTLPIDGVKGNPGENTQVVEGLWALASGGTVGQGLGNGSPNFIPAFHTDMILESIGEQMGWIGIVFILLLLAVLLRKIILIGYKSSHPFALYLCLGIAIVTAVQFIIISLGSTGIIPLTGVTVPFLSYGKVSMILNLFAFGIVLSMAKHIEKGNKEKISQADVRKYDFPISILNMMYFFVTIFIAGVFLYYQVLDRKDVLIKPVYVNNVSGIPVIEYNPRIEQLTRKLYAGNIYDRNGVLLATNDKSRLSNIMNAKVNNNYRILKDINDTVSMNSYRRMKIDFDTLSRESRFYPFGNHLAFMLGDLNSTVFNLRSESCGYMADVRHMSKLRGYNNLLDDDGNPLPKVNPESYEYRPDKWHSDNYYFRDTLQLYNYSALVPYLKAGVNSNKIEKFNNRDESFFAIGKLEPEDVTLTIDAQMQKRLQEEIESYVKDKHSHLNKLRVSVVVIDAKKGDLLTSAIYPLPDYDILKVKGSEVYKDRNRDDKWRAYTDMDLGLMYATAPGSTAKVVTGLAAYRKEGKAIDKAKYYVHDKERIFSYEPAGYTIDVKEAYAKSSNCYFVNLMNDHDLFDDMAQVYASLGITINGHKSYLIDYKEPSEKWMNIITKEKESSIEKYRKYKASGNYKKMNSIPLISVWGWSWGQNGMDATPLAMARAMSVVVNDGKMPITRYTMEDPVENVSVLKSTKSLYSYMKNTAKTHEKGRMFSKRNDVGGKTGTPERVSAIKTVPLKMKNGTIKYMTNTEKANDGWYICFIGDDEPLAIAIRMERLGKGEMSGNATRLMDNVVMKVLTELGYVE